MKDQLSRKGKPQLKAGRRLDVYSLREVAELTGLNLNTVYIHARNGAFPNLFYLGNRKLVPRSDFIAKYGFDPNPERNQEESRELKVDNNQE